jgi:Fe-S cluster assembly protein SufD
MDSKNSIDINTMVPDLPSPLSRDLFWRQCNLKKLLNQDWFIGKGGLDNKAHDCVTDLANAIVFVNGHYSEKLSTVFENIYVSNNTTNHSFDKKNIKNYFRVVNVKLEVPKYQIRFSNAKQGDPLKIVHLVNADQAMMVPLNVTIHIESGFEGRVEFHCESAGPASAWINQCIDYEIDDHAKLSICEFYDNTDLLSVTHTSEVKLGEKANLKQCIANKHFDFMYYQQDVYLNSLMAHWQLHGFYILNHEQRSHYRLKAHHKAQKTESKQFMRGLLSDKSWALFDSSVLVDKGAKGSDSVQMNNNLLLSAKAKVQSFPILEIDEDDVVCSHGSTIGAFDEAMLFYLQSRGLSVEQSFSLMKRAFISEVIKGFDGYQACSKLKKYIDHKA